MKKKHYLIVLMNTGKYLLNNDVQSFWVLN